MPDDLRDLIESNHKEVMAAVRGMTDANGVWHPGLAPTQADHEKRITALEDANETSTNQAMNWRHALGLTLAGGVITKAIDWAQAHIK